MKYLFVLKIIYIDI